MQFGSKPKPEIKLDHAAKILSGLEALLIE
jgi:hypothetical protein